MKTVCLILLFLTTVAETNAQRTEGITNKPDTSYSIWGAYVSTIKTNPEAKIVGELDFSNLVEEKNINYCKTRDRNLLLDIFYAKWEASPKRTAIIIIHGGGWRTGNGT